MNDESTPELIVFCIHFRDMAKEDCPYYHATADVLAAIAADWQRMRPAIPLTPLANAIQRDPSPQVYQVFTHRGTVLEQTPLMFRLEDVLYIG